MMNDMRGTMSSDKQLRSALALILELVTIWACLACLIATPALARESATQLVERALKVQAGLGFSGQVRQDFATARAFSAEARVEFQDARHYKVVGLSPEHMRGVTLWLDMPKVGGYWPKDQLLVTGNAASAYVMSPFVYQILNWKDLNEGWEVRDMGAVDIVALTPARKIALYPRSRSVPFRYIWIDAQTGLVIKEERYLPGSTVPYFRSSFKRVHYPEPRKAELQVVPAAFDIPEGARHLKMPGASGNRVASYATVREAVAATKVAIREPAYLPPGFKVKSVWVAYLLGRPISVITYLDGLNILFVGDRPTIGGLIRFMGNWFSSGLIDKVFELRDYLPLFLHEREVKDRTYSVAGDLPPAELERIYQSLGVK